MSASMNDSTSPISFNNHSIILAQQIWGVIQTYIPGYGAIQYNKSGNVNLTTNQYNIITLIYDGSANIYNQTTLKIRVNGVQTTSIPYNNASTFPQTAITNGHVMYLNASGNISLTSLFFNKSALPTSVVEKIEGFMIHENFVNPTVSNILDASHPYKSAPPTNFS